MQTMSLRCVLILILTGLNLSSGTPEAGKSLVIVIDVTASMSKAIDLLRTESTMLLDNIYKWRGNIFKNYILVQFGDEVNMRDFSQVFEDTNFMNMKNELNEVKIHGPNKDSSCMASSYSGLHIGLKQAKNDSVVLVFTDARTNNKELLPEIKKLIQQKQISIYFTLLNGCDRTKPANDYTDLVSIYNGDVFKVDDTKIEEHFQLLAQILTGPPDPPIVEVIVDSTMSEFILTVTGQNAIITIFDPDQKYVSSARYKMLTNLSSIKMVQVPKPMPGRYTIEIVSETSYSGQVQTKTDLQLKYGFAIHEPTSLLETSYAPYKGHKTYLVISPSNATLIKNLEHVILVTINNLEYKYKLKRKATKNGVLYITEPFPNPTQPFKISVSGRDRLDYRISRLISPVIGAISVNRPEIVSDNNINTFEGDPIHLVCRVQSSVDVTIHWSKIGLHQELAYLESRQNAILNHTIDKSRTSDSGEYICTAENSAGKVTSKSFVTIEHFKVFTPIKIMNIAVGTDRVELPCNVSHINHPTVKVLWLFNGNPELPFGAKLNGSNLLLFNIGRSFNGTYTCIGYKKDVEIRDDIQLNVEYPPKILQFINFNTTSLIDPAHPIEIVNKAKLQIVCAHGSSNPPPIVQWLNQIGDIVSNTANLFIDGRNDLQSDEFSCLVKNRLGQDIRTIKIFKTPEIQPFHVYTPIKLVDTVVDTKLVILQCNVSHMNDPTVKILWLFNESPKLPESSQLNLPNLSLFNIKRNFTGKYTCVGHKETEEMRDDIHLKVEYPPKILYLYNFNTNSYINNIDQPIEIVNKAKLEILCAHEGTPNVKWINQFGDIVSNTSDLIIDGRNDIQSDEFICQVENVLGKDQRKIKIFKIPDPSGFVISTTERSTIVESTSVGTGRPVVMTTTESTTTEKPTSVKGYRNIVVKKQKVDGKTTTLVPLNKNNVVEYQQVTLHLKPQEPTEIERITLKPISNPIVLQTYKKTEELIEGKPFTMRCPIENGEYNVSWILNGKSIDHLKLSNESIFIDSVYPNMNGDVLCIASNKAGSVNASINFVVLRRPYDIEVNISPERNFFENNHYEIECRANGNPEIFWMKNGAFFRSESTIIFEKVQPKDQGNYTCVATNPYGNINKTFILQISAPFQNPKYETQLETSPNILPTLSNINNAGLINTLISSENVGQPYDIQVDASKYKSPFVNYPYEIKCSAKGEPQPIMYWMKNDNFFENGKYIGFQTLQQNDSANYTCIAENYIGKINKTYNLQVSIPKPFVNPTGIIRATNTKKPSTNLNILSPPYDIHIDKLTSNQLFVTEPYVMKCSAKGNPEPYIYWEKNNIFWVKGDLIAFEHLQLSDHGRYTCFAQNPLGFLNQTNTLFVYSAPIFANPYDFFPTTNVNNVNQFGASSVLRFIPVHHDFFFVNFEKIIEVNEHESFVLNCTMDGYPAPHIEWYKNNVLQKWNQSVLMVKNAYVPTSGLYKCVGTNDYGQLKAIFYVNVKKRVSIVSITSSKRTYKRGDQLSIQCKATGNLLPIIRIYFNSNQLLSGTDHIFNVKPTPILFQRNKRIYFDGNNITHANRVQSLNRYSMLKYDGSYVGTFYYVIKSLRPEDAGIYTCLALTTSMQQYKQIAIKINKYS